VIRTVVATVLAVTIHVMSNKSLNALFVCLFFVLTEVQAQESVSPNGKFATIHGARIYYEESGKGMPLILLHNFFATASRWKTYVPELAKNYRVIAVDLPGHGRSDYMDTTEVFLHKKATEYIIGLIDALKLDSVNLMGASSGGSITLHLATLRPDLVRRAVVIGGHIYYPKQTREIVSKWSKNPSADNVSRHGKEKATLLQKQFIYFSQLYGDPAFTPDILSTIRAKTLIIHGDNDELAPISNALGMHQNIPGSYLWIVPSGGHLPHLDPKNEGDFIRRTMEFLNGDWDKK
jgi:pimeloyl-ACP methyl ester carboxylesterase